MSFLTKDRRDKIKDVIDDLNIEQDLSFPENSVVVAADRLGVPVKIAKFKDETIAGLLDYGDQENDIGPAIFVSSQDAEKKRNFTIAHEIGHLLLHADNGAGRLKVDRHDVQNLKTKSITEEEADYFAASLLVPGHRLKEIMFKSRMHKWDLINFCSDYFNVSKSVISNRLKWINF